MAETDPRVIVYVCVWRRGWGRGLSAAQIFRNTFAFLFFPGKADWSTGVRVAALCLKLRNRDVNLMLQRPCKIPTT